MEKMVSIDRASSTVEFAGRRWPAVGLICPPVDGDESESEYSRGLGVGGNNDESFYLPAENGLLVFVEEQRNEKYHGLTLALYARTCEMVPNELLWLPRTVRLYKGQLVTHINYGVSYWSWAEPEWVAETVDRLSRKMFFQPPGPQVKLVRLDYVACNA